MTARPGDGTALGATTALCFYCGRPKAQVLHDNPLAPAEAALDREPCPSCAGMMRQGILLIQVRDNAESGDTVFRTGPIALVNEDLLRAAVQPPELVTRIIEARYAFIPVSAWRLAHFPEDP